MVKLLKKQPLQCCKIINGIGFFIGFSGNINSTGTFEGPYLLSESFRFIVSLKLKEGDIINITIYIKDFKNCFTSNSNLEQTWKNCSLFPFNPLFIYYNFKININIIVNNNFIIRVSFLHLAYKTWAAISVEWK